MQTVGLGWKVFDPGPPILTYEYSFGAGFANALAVGGENGLLVVSPPCHVDEGVFDQLAAYAPVRALIASNAFHHLGLAEWKAHFPEAAIFAPSQAIGRVQKRSKLTGVRPLVEAASITGPRLELVDMPYYKTGEVLVRIDAVRGLVWYVTDIIMNMTVLPHNPVARFAFRASGSGPGLRFNNIAPLFMVKDKKALRRWVADEFRKAPPRWLIAAHGDIVDFAANTDAARCLFDSS
jgi:hypothetical protein